MRRFQIEKVKLNDPDEILGVVEAESAPDALRIYGVKVDEEHKGLVMAYSGASARDIEGGPIYPYLRAIIIPHSRVEDPEPCDPMDCLYLKRQHEEVERALVRAMEVIEDDFHAASCEVQIEKAKAAGPLVERIKAILWARWTEGFEYGWRCAKDSEAELRALGEGGKEGA